MTARRPREHAGPLSPPDRRPPRRGGGSSPYIYASAAGRPAGPARLCGARRGLVRSAGALAAAALLALSGALALPATAEAQTVVLVSNTGQADDGAREPFSNQDYAQPFDTGSNTTGYNLASVVLDFTDAPTDTGTVTVTVREDNAGVPSDTVLYTMTGGTIVSGANEFTAPTGASLDGATLYHVVLEYDAAGGPTWTRTQLSNGVDSGNAAGWAIDDAALLGGVFASGTTWSVPWSTRAFQIQVKGSAKAGPPVWSATMTAGDTQAGHGYDATVTPAIGMLDDDDFDYGSTPATAYRVLAIDVASNVVRFVVDGLLPTDDALTLELGGHALASSDRITIGIGGGRTWYWAVPDALDDLATEFPVGSTATVCLRTATQTCPAGRIVTPSTLPTLSIADASGAEGAGVEFTATLSAEAAADVTATWTATIESDDTAVAADDLGSTKTGEVTVSMGELTGTFDVPTAQDNTDEWNETFTVTLTGVSANAILGTATATGTIDDDDELPVLSAAALDAEVTEGESATFTLTLSPASGKRVAIPWGAVSGTAWVGVDFPYTDAPLLYFEPGETSKTLTVPTTDDAIDEEDEETFLLDLRSGINLTYGGGAFHLSVPGTILDDDDPPTLSVDDVSAAEGGDLTFTVELSAESEREVTVDWEAATLDAEGDDAEEGTDFAAASGTLTFTPRTHGFDNVTGDLVATPGETTKTFTVSTTDDAVDEEDETFTVTLSNPTHATIPDATAKGTITSDDTPAVTNVTVTSAPVLASDTYGAGETIAVAVDFSAPVNAATGTDLVLSVGGAERAALLSGSGTQTLVFGYTVQPGDEDDDGIWMGDGDRTLAGNRNGTPQNGAITSVATGLDAVLDHSALGQQDGHKVDGSRSIVSVEVTSTPALTSPGETTPDTYGVGETIRFTVTFNTDVDVVGDPVFTFALGNSGEVRDVDAALESGTGTNALVFAYTVVSSDEDNNGIFLRDEDDFNNPDGPVRLDSDDTIRLAGTSTDVPLYWEGRGTQSGHKVDGSRRANNNTPVFADATATFEVPENSAAGTNVGAAIPAATDADNDLLSYSMEGPDATSFGFDASTRQITTVANVDYNFEAAKNSYTVTVKADDGFDTATATVTINVTDVDEQSDTPAKPELAAVTGSATSLSATWAEPGLNGGPAITGYKLEYRVSPDGAWMDFAHTGTTVTTTITGLTANTEYQARVQALNGETPSDWSDPSDAERTNRVNNPPSFTTPAAITVAENVSAAGTVEAVDNDTGDDITGYAITGGADQALFEIGATDGVLSFKTAPNFEDSKDSGANNTYEVTVEATSGAGDREATATQAFTVTVTDAAEQPDTPAKPTLEAISDSTTSLTATWVEPGLNGGPAIAGYNVQYRERPDGTWMDFAHDGTAVTATITGLTANTQYQVRVQALNGETPSEWSSPSDAERTTAGPPVLTRALVRGDSAGRAIRIEFDQDIETAPNHADLRGAFSLTADGGTRNITRIGRAFGSRSIFDLGVSPPIFQGQPVVLSYDRSAAGSRALANDDGTEVEDFTTGAGGVPAVVNQSGRVPLLNTFLDREGDEDEGVEFTIRLDERAHAEVAVTWQVTIESGDTAVAADLGGGTLTLGRATIVKGEREGTFTVPIVDDAADEPDETFTVTLSNPTNTRISSATARGTILDDDDPPTLSVADVSAPEGGVLTFTATLAPASGKQVTVDWEAAYNDALGDTTADDGSDFTEASGTLTFEAGETVETFTVSTTEDATVESDETFTVTFSNASNVTLPDPPTARGTITDDDAAMNEAPSFTSPAAFDAAENQTLVGTVAATDGDADDAITGYAVTGGADQALFEIDGTTGALTFTTAPDFEDPQDSGADNRYEVTVQATSGTDAREKTATQSIVVTVTNADEGRSGTVTIDDTSPTVGDELTASTANVADPDGLPDPFAPTWQWYRTPTSGSETMIPGAASATYTVVEADLGATLTAKASWTDKGGFENTLESAATSAVAAGDTAPVWSATMTAGDTQVGHGYDATDTPAVGTLDDDDFVYESLPHTVLAIDVGNVVRFVVEGGLPMQEALTLEFGGHALAFSDRISVISINQSRVWNVPDALDDLATEFPVGSTATVCLRTATQVCPAGRIVTPNTPPVFTSSATLSIPENVDTLTVVATDNDAADDVTGYAITGGADNLFFRSVENGLLVFDAIPNFENPRDAGSDNTYEVTVQATSGAGDRVMTATQTITVTVTNADEGQSGTVTIDDTTPTVGDDLTASTADAADPDGLPDPFAPTWKWYRTPDGGSETEISGETSATYTVVEADLGATLTAKASWTDKGGFENTLESAATSAVAAASALPTLSIADAAGTEGGDVTFTATLSATAAADVTATWTASIESDDTAADADLGTTKTGTVTVTMGQDTGTFDVPTAQDTANEADETFTVTLSGVSTNAELAADPTATGTIVNDDAPGAPTDFRAEVGDTQVELAWDAPAPGANITRHEVRRKEGSGSYPAAFTPIPASAPGGANEKGYTVTGLTNEVAYTFELRAVNDAGNGTAAEAGPVTPTPGICGRTQVVRDGILDEVPGVTDCKAVTVANLAAITGTLDLEDEGITSLQSGDFAGLTALDRLYLPDNDFSSLPLGVFSGLTGLTRLYLHDNDDLTSLPDGVFAGLTALENIRLYGTGLTSLPDGAFDGLTALETLRLHNNQLTSLPDEVFDGLMALKTLHLSGNDLSSLPDEVFKDLTALTSLTLNDNDLDALPDGAFTGLTALAAATLSLGNNPNSGDDLPLTVTVEKVGTDQARAKVAAGAPFAVDFTPTVANGSLPASDTKLAVAAGSVDGTAQTVTRTSGTTAAVTVDIDLSTQPTLPTKHSGYEFAKATGSEPTEILPAETALPTLSIADSNADEGEGVEFTVTLSEAAAADVTVTWTASLETGDTAETGDFTDLPAATGTLTFSASTSQTMATFTVATKEDSTDEEDETFTVTLSNPSTNAQLAADPTATGTIDDDDDAPVVGITSTSGHEGRDPNTLAPTLALSAVSEKTVTVTWTASIESGDTAVAADFEDLSAATGTVDITPGRDVTALHTFHAQVFDDAIDEDDETFTVTLSNPVNATVGQADGSSDATGTMTIIDDDDPPTLSVADVAAEEGAPLVFTVALSPESAKTVTVAVATSVETGDTATSGTDFTAVGSTTLTFTAGQTQKTVTVTTAEETTPEPDETFTLTLSSPTNATLSATAATAKGTIDDDDGATTPTVTGVEVTSTPLLETDTYGAGETIEVSVTFSEAVTATTATDFVLSVGGATRAPLLRGSGTATLVFGYTVAPGDEDDNGIWIGDETRTLVGNRNGEPQNGTITSAAVGTAADLDHPGPGEQSGHKVDGTRSIRTVEVISTPQLETDTYGAGETIRFRVTFNVAVDVDGDPVFEFALDGGASRSAAYETGGGTTALVFGYTVVSGDTDTNGIFLWDEADFDDPDGPVRLDSDDTIRFAVTDTDVPLYWAGRGTQSGHKVDGSRTTGNTAPSFTSSATFDAAENQTSAGTVAATDSDSDDSVTGYEITGGADQALFEIGATTGELTFKSAPDFEDPQDSGTDNVHEVTVQTTSGTGTRVMTATQTITVTVTNADEGQSGTVTIDDTTPMVGDELTASTADAADPDGLPDPFAPTWKWYRTPDGGSETEITGETSATYTVVEADLDATLTAKASWTDKGGFANTLSSASTSAVAAASTLPTLSIGDETELPESGTVLFDLTLSAVAAANVTVTCTASLESGDTAEANDLTLEERNGLVLAGTTTGTCSIAISSDTLDEEDETFTVTMSGVSSNAQLAADPTATGTIVDDDPTPTVTVADATATEGDKMEFAVTLSAVSGRDVTVAYATSVGTGQTATSGTDFTAADGTLTILAAGATDTGTIEVQTTEDSTEEEDETFTLTISNPTNATLGTKTAAKGTIVDDDAAAAPTITGVAVTSTPVLETDTYGAGEEILFTVTFSGAVDVTGDPEFAFSLDTGEDRAAYKSGSGTTALVFGYTVLAADEDDDGIFLLDGSDFNNRDGAVTLDSDDAIKAAGSTTDADLAHTGRGTESGHKVDGTRSIVSVAVTSTPQLETDTYGAGETILFTVTFNVAVDVAGTPVLEFLFDGSEVRQAGDVSGSGTTGLVFHYLVVSGDDDDNGLFIRDESDYNNPDGPVRLDSDDEIEFKDTSTDVPLYWQGRGTQTGHKVDGSRTTGNVAPSFTSSAARHVTENTTAVVTVTATDSDADDSVTGYEITGGADQALFEIGATTGVLTFKSAPNFEDELDQGTDNDYVVVVQATSGTGTREMTATQTITVTVTDADEQSAKPDKPELEAVTGSSTSLTATWETPDKNGGPAITGYKLEYKLSTETSWTAFAHTGTAVTTTITGLTADTAYQARVRAENGETDSDWSDASDAVSTNAETVTPTCTLNTGDLWCGVVTVGPITIGGVVVGHGFGAGTGDLSDKTFDIGTNSYTIDGVVVTSGALSFSLTSALTAAEKEKLVLHVGSSTFAFSDAGAPTSTFNYQWPPSSLDWTSETSVTLRLREANTAPVFADDLAAFTLPENSAVGTSVGAAVTATDADSDTLTYSLEGTDAASFDIESGTGQIKTKSGVTYDFEATQNTYEMTVKADDGNGGTDTIEVNIALLDADEKSAKPDKPELEKVTGSTTSLTATWEAPDLNGGPDITGYDLQYRAAPAGTWMDFAHSDTAVTTTVTGLTADTAYQARVRAENGETDSDWSDASDAVSTNAEAVTPGCTLNTAARDIWCGVLTVADLGGSHGFSGNTGDLSDPTFSVGTNSYTIRQVNVGDPTSTKPGTLIFSLDRMPLDAADRARLVLHIDGITDTFAFSAATQAAHLHEWTGTGLDWSSATSVTLRLRLTPQAPDKPTNLMAEADGDTRIALSWEAPADDGGSAITGYRIEVSDDGSSGSWRDRVPDTGNDATSYTHEGLSAGDTRHYRVSAINAEGRSEASDVAHATTMPEDPAADASLSALTVTHPGGSVALRPVFAPETEEYRASVANAVDEVTVAAEANVAGATLAYLDDDDNALDDADTGTPGREVALAVGETTVQVKVTAADGDAMRTYRVRLTRRAMDAPGVEGELRLTEPEPYADEDNDRYGGRAGRVEVFHAGAWGTVCSDGIRSSTFSTFNYDSTTGALILDTDDNPTETENDNEAAALICQDRGYDDGEYHTKYSKYRRGAAVTDHQVADYWPASRPYTGAAMPIWIDDLRCVAGDSALMGDGALPGEMSHCGYAGWGLHNCTHKEDAVVRCWNNDAAGPGIKSLQGRFVSPPERHDGTNRIKVRVAFSEAPENVGADGVEVEGGAVTSVSPVGGNAPGGAGTRSVGGRNAGREDREVVWEFEIEPDSDGDVTVSFEAGRPCDEEGAICTADGRSLSEDISTTVEGPDEGPPPLTASFEDLPEAHDGESAFTFRIAFSERVGWMNGRRLREDVVAVSGGRATAAGRVDRRRDLWQVTVEPDSPADVTVTLEAGAACRTPAAVCTSDGRALSATISATVAGPAVETGPAPLTASFVDVPAEHDGESAFKLRIAFSETIRMSGRRLRDEVVAVAGGRATKGRRVNKRKDLWKLTVKPDSLADVTVTLAAGAACDSPAAVCTKDGRALTTTISTTVRGPVTVSVADARAEEGTDATLDFAVTLSRAASGAVTVAYATADGTATAGSDYTETRGTLTFAPGETAKTVAVAVLDDAHDEGEETLTLTLTTPSGAVLADRFAIGTIENSDPLQQAWLARFGRTAATHVTDAVGDRLQGTPGQESHLTVGGYRLPVGQAAAAGPPEAGGAAPGAEADKDSSSLVALMTGLARVLGLGPGQAGGTGPDPWGDRPAVDPRLGQSQSVNVDLRRLLLGSSFRLTFGRDTVGAGGPRLTAWGRVAGTTFNGRDGKVSLAGDVLTGTVGVDGEWDRLLAGLAVAHSRGDGSFTMPGTEDRGRGGLENTLTSVHPYLRYAVNDRLAVWGLFGYGWGELDLEMDNGMTIETDTNLVMGAFGGRGILLAAAESGGFQLASRTDAMLTRTTSEGVSSTTTGNLKATDAEAHRLRLVLEGSRGFTWAEGRRLTPTMEVGLRHDWGDAETGFGLELGGRVQYADPALGLTIEAAVRGLLAHEDRDYKEWGASGTVRLAPGATGQGLSLTLSPAWGATASGVNGLWSRQTTAGLAPQGTRQSPAGRLTAEVGYGFAPFDTGLLTPYVGTVLSEGAARTYRVGTRLQLGGPSATGLTLNLEGTRQEPAGPQPATQGLRLQATWKF